MSRRLFAAGSWVLVATGIVHLVGHYALVTNEGASEAERQLLAAMRGDHADLGLGFVRTTFDLLTGFSLTFSVLPLGMGLLGLVLLRHAGRAPGLLRQASIVYAGSYGIMTALAFRYWFPAPLFFVLAAFLCFAAAVATAPREAA